MNTSLRTYHEHTFGHVYTTVNGGFSLSFIRIKFERKIQYFMIFFCLFCTLTIKYKKHLRTAKN